MIQFHVQLGSTALLSCYLSRACIWVDSKSIVSNPCSVRLKLVWHSSPTSLNRIFVTRTDSDLLLLLAVPSGLGIWFNHGQRIGTGQETNPWSLDIKNRQDEQWQWSQWSQWQWRWALCRPSINGKARTAASKTWVWARTSNVTPRTSTIAFRMTATTIATGASTIAPGTSWATASLSRWCWCLNGQSREKATTTSTTSFWNSRSREAATTTSQIGGWGYGRRSRYSFFVHGQTKSLIYLLRPTTTKDPNKCVSWKFWSVTSAKNTTPTLNAHDKDLIRLIPNQLGCMRDWIIVTVALWIPVELGTGLWQGRWWRINA